MIHRVLVPLLLLLGCSPAPTEIPEVLEVLAPEGVEFRLVMSADDPGTTAFSHDGKSLNLGPPQPFALARMWSSTDSRGMPAIGFQLDEEDADGFAEWTGSNIGSMFAFVVDDAVICASTLEFPLRSGGIIRGGGDEFSEEKVREILEAVRPATR